MPYSTLQVCLVQDHTATITVWTYMSYIQKLLYQPLKSSLNSLVRNLIKVGIHRTKMRKKLRSRKTYNMYIVTCMCWKIHVGTARFVLYTNYISLVGTRTTTVSFTF